MLDKAGPAKLAKPSRAGGVHLHSSPSEILDALSPPMCKLTLNQKDHRWVSTWRHDSEMWSAFPELQRKTFSRSFEKDSRASWVQKLQQVHKFMWEKWLVAKAELPLEDGQEEPDPGHISEECLQELAPVIKAMPAKTSY